MNIRTGITGLTATIRQDRKSPKNEGAVEAAPPTTGHQLFDGVLDTGFFLFNELVETGKNDPALALRYGATSLSEQLLTGVGENVRTTFNTAIIPTIRFCILGANGYRMQKTLKDPTAHIAEKAFDIARMATDVMGLAGSVMKYAWPEKAALGDTLVGMSYAADSVSHSVRLMTHGAERVTVWKKALAERKEANRREREVSPPTDTAPGTFGHFGTVQSWSAPPSDR